MLWKRHNLWLFVHNWQLQLLWHTYKHTDIATLWSTRPRGPSQWKYLIVLFMLHFKTMNWSHAYGQFPTLINRTLHLSTNECLIHCYMFLNSGARQCWRWEDHFRRVCGLLQWHICLHRPGRLLRPDGQKCLEALNMTCLVYTVVIVCHIVLGKWKWQANTGKSIYTLPRITIM